MDGGCQAVANTKQMREKGAKTIEYSNHGAGQMTRTPSWHNSEATTTIHPNRYSKSYNSHLSSVENLQELLAGGTGRRLLDGRTALLGAALLLDELLTTEGLCVGVETEEDGLVAEGVLLLGEGA